MNIFIDTNILLGFYETSTDSLVELEKIAVLLKQGKATLWLPDQVEKEFWNNREASIEKHLSEFEKFNALGAVPLLVKEHAEFNSLKKASHGFETKRDEIIASVRAAVFQETTEADKLVRRLFSAANKIDTTGAIFAAAHERALRHLPPGKQEGVGDRLCWLALLTSVPEKNDLFIISDDGDYASEADNDEIHSYLRHEWKSKKDSAVTLWKRASKFLAKHVPNAGNAIEAERALMVERMEKTSNFASTHKIVAEFSDLSQLNPPLVQRLAQAILTNSQVASIVEDADVKEFVQKFLTLYGAQMSPPTKTKIEEILPK